MTQVNIPAPETQQPVSITPLSLQHTPFSSQERLSTYEIIWIEQGHWEIEVNNHSLHLTAASACFLMPGQVCLHKAAHNMQGYRIHISEDYFYLTTSHKSYTFCHSNFINHPWQCSIKEEKAALLGIILTIFRQECASPKPVNNHIILDWLKLLLNYLDTGHTSDTIAVTPVREQQIVQEFLRLLSSHFTKLKKVADYACKMAVTPTHLNHIVKKASGYPASFHIQQYIIMEAKRQALNTSKSMKEIAYELGFSDSSHFSKFFKNNTGVNFTCFKSSRAGIV